MESTISQYLTALYDQLLSNRDGAVADYIPELANVKEDGFAISLATVDGNLYEIGDVETRFTIQSVSKPFTYGLALIDNGLDHVANFIDVEPSGDPFNEISIDPKTRHPRNAMINAGAITATALIHGETPDARFARISEFFARLVGHELDIDEPVFRSEIETSDRNRAIGYMLREAGVLHELPETAIDSYVRQCSLRVTCSDLALMAATLANDGCQPISEERVLPSDINRHVLSVMASSGMYNAAGDWLTNVGLPAKSGVGGGILAVLPGQCGIAVYSPRLDEFGNSTRGVAAFKQLSRDLGLHFLNVNRRHRPAIRAISDLPGCESTPRQQVRLVEMQGNLLFSGAENVERALFEMAEAGICTFIIDVADVDIIDEVARRMLIGLARQLETQDVTMFFVDPDLRLHTESDQSILKQFATRGEAIAAHATGAASA